MAKTRFASWALPGMAAALLAGVFCWRAVAADVGGTGNPAPDYLHWAVPAADAKYGVIDGRHIWQYVAEQAKIAEQYRDSGHPQFWGRLAGTSSDVADVEWLQDKYRQIGLTTRVQTINYFNPQWSAQTWAVT